MEEEEEEPTTVGFKFSDQEKKRGFRINLNLVV